MTQMITALMTSWLLLINTVPTTVNQAIDIANTPVAYVEEIEIEYPDATYIWDYLQELEYSDEVCAGILGNMMVECAGQCLDLQPTIETKSYYGICQWSKKFYPDVIGCSLESQCDFLRDTIQNELDTFGYKYKKGFNYEDFLALEDERDVALAFAKCYERCGSGSYEARQDCAETALEYFTELAGSDTVESGNENEVQKFLG